MNKGLKALKEFREHYFFELDEEENLNAIEKDLNDFEWLKSKVSIDWFDKLSSDDKIRFMEIMGWKYE